VQGVVTEETPGKDYHAAGAPKHLGEVFRHVDFSIFLTSLQASYTKFFEFINPGGLIARYLVA
jgi:hypothetical protein